MIKPPVERRTKTKKRAPVRIPCAYSAETAECGEATTFDISEGGMCFYSNRQVKIEQTIHIQCNDLWEKPKKGVVRWCQKVHHRLYRVGVKFEDGGKAD